MIEFKPLPYWRAKPRQVDAMFVCLLVPAVVWVVGFILLTGPVHITASRLNEYDQQLWGSWLMVIGGESGTLVQAAEVFRKRQQGTANKLDWWGLGVSLVASLATGLSLFVRQTNEVWPWVLATRPALPLVLRLSSIVDFYGNAMELGFYVTHYDERVRQWEKGQHDHLMRERTRMMEYDAEQSERRAAHDAPPVAQVERIEPAQAEHSGNGNGTERHECEHCGRTFGSAQAVSAHKRFCPALERAQSEEVSE